jgi:hypothetical protein
MKPTGKLDRAWLAIVLVFCVYAALFIYRTSFVIGGTRYFSLFDDAMISMTYARNLAAGHGLVWNAGGERVEGYTNLGWTLYMALLHLAPVAKAKMSLLVQISSALALLAGMLFTRRIAYEVSGGSRLVMIGAALAAGFYLPIVSWSLQGMEVGLLTLLVTAAAWKAIGAMRSGRFSPWPYALLALAMMVRLDMAVPFCVTLAYMLRTDRANRRRHLVSGLACLAAGILPQTIFRLVYYGDWLPNTYYLKLTGYPFIYRLTRGLYVTFVFIWRLNVVFFLVPFALLGLRRRDKSLGLLLWIFVGQLGYSVYVGGDAWESWGGANRYVCVAMPCFFVVFFEGCNEFGRRIKTYLAECGPASAEAATQRRMRRAGIALVAVSLLSFNAIYGPAAIGEAVLLKLPVHVDDNRNVVRLGLALADVTDQQARLAVVWDGAIVYFADRPAVSMLGKSDRKIAHEPMRVPAGREKLVGFYPGHLKWDYAYSIGQMKPDVVVQVWLKPDEATPYLAEQYTDAKIGGRTMGLRNGSPHIRWDMVRRLETSR